MRYWLWPSLLCVLVVAQVFVFTLYLRDQRFLGRKMDSIASSGLPPSEQALRVLAYLREKPVITNDSYFLLPVFGFMRATSRQVDEQGGDCADRARLLVTLLDLHGINSSKWALYSPRIVPRHAVVQVETEKGPMVVDGLYGLYYPRPIGGYYGIEDLRHLPGLVPERIHKLEALHEEPGGMKLEQYPLDTYIYAHARSINWDKAGATLALYRILRSITGSRVDEIVRPKWVEQPAVMVAIVLGLLEFWVLLAWLITVKRGRSNVALRTRQLGLLGTNQSLSPVFVIRPIGSGESPRSSIGKRKQSINPSSVFPRQSRSETD
jgi:hypothetical protein